MFYQLGQVQFSTLIMCLNFPKLLFMHFDGIGISIQNMEWDNFYFFRADKAIQD